MCHILNSSDPSKSLSGTIDNSDLRGVFSRKELADSAHVQRVLHEPHVRGQFACSALENKGFVQRSAMVAPHGCRHQQ